MKHEEFQVKDRDNYEETCNTDLQNTVAIVEVSWGVCNVNCLIEAGEEFIYAQSSKLRHKSEKLH
jgi:hypothetical protein